MDRECIKPHDYGHATLQDEVQYLTALGRNFVPGTRYTAQILYIQQYGLY